MLIPALPPKKTTTGVHRDVEGDFVRARMNALDIFMKMLTKIPFLIADPALEAFCSKSAGPEWDSSKSRIDAGADVQPNVGCQEWRKVCLLCSSPSHPYPTYDTPYDEPTRPPSDSSTPSSSTGAARPRTI